MPMRRCTVCGRMENYSKADYKYLDKDGELVCSVDCCIDWLYLGESDHPLEVPEFNNVNGRSVGEIHGADMPHDAYSPYLKRWFRSFFEMHVTEVFEHLGHRMSYEKYGFMWAGTKMYIPDLFCEATYSFIEIKGKWQASQRTKYKKFRKVFPEIRLLVIPWTLDTEFREKRKELGI